MDYIALIQHKGETREYHDEWPDSFSGEGLEFMWTDGNYACDCNRALFWNRIKGKDDPDVPCGDGEYVVPYLTLANGTRIWIDAEEGQAWASNH